MLRPAMHHLHVGASFARRAPSTPYFAYVLLHLLKKTASYELEQKLTIMHTVPRVLNTVAREGKSMEATMVYIVRVGL